ncbi:MAG: sugar ABC transporter permease [Treponema sp.]|nr:sugar ABC transporter permease [Treponema sp.]
MIKPGKEKLGLIARKEQRAAYLFLIPAFLGLSLITYGPLLAVFGVSLTNLSTPQIHGYSTKPIEFVGLRNFIDILDKNKVNFLNSIKVTLYFSLFAVIASVVYSLFIAMLLNRKIPGRGFFRAVFYVPYILPATGVIVGWALLTQREPDGLFNNILSGFGLPKSFFMSSSAAVIPTLVLIAVWGCGNLIVIFLAGLQNVPRVYHEAAEIDGANAWQRFWRITIPCMTPIIFYNLLMSLVTSLQVVVPALAQTQGGPGQATNFMTYVLYWTGIRNGDLGRAGAISVVFFIIAAILAFILFITSKQWIFYEGDGK